MGKGGLYKNCLYCGYDEPIGAPTPTPEELKRWLSGYRRGEPVESRIDRERRKRIGQRARRLAMEAMR
jgi:hypothetical protein